MATLQFECCRSGIFPFFLPIFPSSIIPSPPKIRRNTTNNPQISVILILPETKGMSLERMDAIFGEVDAVAAGESETGAEKIEARTYASGIVGDGDEKMADREYIEHSDSR